MRIAVTPDIRQQVDRGAAVAIGVSGGKDSQAAALATVQYLDAIGHRGARVLIHSDLGAVEWDASLPTCKDLAEHLGVELIVVRRKAGGLMERWEARWRSSVERYRQLLTVTLVPCWSTPAMRFCTSELKTQVIVPELRRRYGDGFINVTGVRRAESRQRAKATVADLASDGRSWNWRPLADWSEADVFAAIDSSGLRPHPAYHRFGMSRVSCRFCIMSSAPDLRAAAAQPEALSVYRSMVDLEARSTFAFQGSRWLADVAPDLLSDDECRRIENAKAAASRRVAIEGRITPAMLYVKGWPTRVLTDAEADVLASVRQTVGELMSLDCDYVDRRSIQRRYADLMMTNRAAA